ncbi:hypothetical protein BMETH_19391185417, partial [methanotrophic bacterial endosymbiont of Bathymodiolus sp.]
LGCPKQAFAKIATPRLEEIASSKAIVYDATIKPYCFYNYFVKNFRSCAYLAIQGVTKTIQ